MKNKTPKKTSKIKGERVTRAEGYRRLGIRGDTFDDKMETHGVKKGRDGKFLWSDIQAADIAGKEMDKAAKESELPGKGPLTLAQQRTKKQIEKLAIEIKKSQAELDVMLGKLADVDEIANRYTRLLSDMAQRLSTWRESTIAKRPKLRKDVEDCYRQLQTSLEAAGE